MTPQIEQARKVFQQRIDWNNQSISQTGDPDGFMRNENNAYSLALRVLGRCNEEFIRNLIIDTMNKEGKRNNGDKFNAHSYSNVCSCGRCHMSDLLSSAILQSLIAEESSFNLMAFPVEEERGGTDGRKD